MVKVVFAAAVGLTVLSACVYRPEPADAINIVNDPLDVSACRRLAAVSGPVATSTGFSPHIDAMLAETIALGGTDLLLRRLSTDWSLVRGDAYRCPPGIKSRRVITEPVLRVRG